MSQHPASPEQPEQPEQPDEGQGTFVGGDFGTSDDAEAEQRSTAQQIEAEGHPAHLVDPSTAPAEAEEFVTGTSDPDTFDSDVEGTSTEPSPGERNEPL